MKRLTYTKPHQLSQLHDELLAAGITPKRVEGLEAGQTAEISEELVAGPILWLSVDDDVDEATIAAVVAAHDPTTPPQDNATVMRERLKARIVEIEDLAAKLSANAATADERTRLLVLVAQGVARLARLELGQLDKAT